MTSVVRLLRLAGPGSRLAARPRSAVAHVTTGGDVTPAGFLSSRGTPVCHANTRRLTVLTDLSPTVPDSRRRVCRRCTARLRRIAAEPCSAPTRADDVTAHADLTAWDLAVDLLEATHEIELRRLELRAWQLLGIGGAAKTPVVGPDGTAHPPFDELLRARRAALRLGWPSDITPEEQAQENERRRLARLRRQRDRQDAWAEKKAAHDGLGFRATG